MSKGESRDNATFMVKVRKTLDYYGKRLLWRWRDLVFPVLQPEGMGPNRPELSPRAVRR